MVRCESKCKGSFRALLKNKYRKCTSCKGQITQGALASVAGGNQGYLHPFLRAAPSTTDRRGQAQSSSQRRQSVLSSPTRSQLFWSSVGAAILLTENHVTTSFNTCLVVTQVRHSIRLHYCIYLTALNFKWKAWELRASRE